MNTNKWSQLPDWAKWTIALSVAMLAFITYTIAASSGVGQQCIVTALGGNKLCGADARAWCDSTDEIRAMNSTDPTVSKTQDLCDSMR